MPDPVFFAPLRVPITDPRTGLMSREWYLFLEAMWRRTGGAIAPNIDDLLQNSADGVSTADVLALLFQGIDGINQSQELSELRARVDQLEQEVQALKQGPVM